MLRERTEGEKRAYVEGLKAALDLVRDHDLEFAQRTVDLAADYAAPLAPREQAQIAESEGL